MKILNIITVGTTSGGAEMTVFSSKSLLEKKGNMVKTLASDIKKSGIDFSDYSFQTVSIHNPLNSIFQLFNPYAYMKLHTILSEYEPDVVHLHTMWHVSPSVLFLLRKYPTVMTLHGPEAFLPSFIHWFLPRSDYKTHSNEKENLTLKGKFHYLYFSLLRGIYSVGLKNVDLFIAPSEYIKKCSNHTLSPIKNLFNGIVLFPFSQPLYTKSLVYVGRLEEVKGIMYLLDALPGIIQQHPNATLTIIGEGSYKESLQKTIKASNMDKSVMFKPWGTQKELEKAYKKADIVIVPSIWPEVFGRVIIEAMSVGRPVIGTRVGGIPEIISHGKTGYLVDPKNADQITQKVNTLLSDKKLLALMGLQARKKAERFSIEQYTKSLENIYRSLMKKYSQKKFTKKNNI